MLLSSFVLTLLVFVHSSSCNDRHRKRDSQWTPTDPQAFAVPLGIDAQGRYVTSVGMGRHPVQHFNFLLSTSSPYTMVAGTGCKDCTAQIGSNSVYDSSASDTDTTLGSNVTFSMGSGVASGITVQEDCNFKTQNGSEWWYPKQTVVVASNSQGILGNGASGLVGLGRSSGNDSFIATVFNKNPAWTNVTFGIALGNAGGPLDSGIMHVRELDNTLYDGDLNYYPVSSAAGDVPANIPTDWALRLDSWSVEVGSTQTQFTSGGIAIVETYFSEIRLPQPQALVFYRNIDGSKQYNDTTGLSWTLPCNTSLAFTATFGSQSFRVESDKLIKQSTKDDKGICEGNVKAWMDPAVKSYLLGAAFAETVYIAYNANRNGTGDSIGIAPRSNRKYDLGGSGLSKGAIAGVAIGSVVGFAAVAAILTLLWRQHRFIKSVVSPVTPTSGKTKYKIEPYSTSSTRGLTETPQPSTTAATTPWIIEQGPIGGDVGLTAALLQNHTPDASPSALSAISPSHRKAAEAASESSRPTSHSNPANNHLNTRASVTTASSSELLRQLSLSAGTNHNPNAQIHYHIHVSSPSAAAPSSFHSGGMVAPEPDYGDDPVPEYSERSTTNEVPRGGSSAPSSVNLPLQSQNQA